MVKCIYCKRIALSPFLPVCPDHLLLVGCYVLAQLMLASQLKTKVEFPEIAKKPDDRPKRRP